MTANTSPAGATIPFLALVGERERDWKRVLLVLFGGGALALLALSLAMFGTLLAASAIFAGPLDRPLLAAMEVFTSAETDRPLITFLGDLAVVGVSFGVGMAVFLAVASRVYARPALSFLTAAPRFRWRAVGFGFAVAALLMAASMAIQLSFATPEGGAPLLRTDAGPADKLGYALGAAVLLYLAALTEELIYRGWGQQQVWAITRRIPVILIASGLLFSLSHGDPNWDAFIIRAAMGIAWGWIVLRTHGLEFASGMHLGNNLMIVLWIEPVTIRAPEAAPFDLLGLALEFGVLAALVALVEVARRRPALARTLGIAAPA
ncbi:MAG TPA: type II CAAX endopeptidase family protein [Phenylobacterium sp.]